MNSIEQLGKNRLFDQLTEDEVSAFQEKFHKGEVASGEYIFREGDVGDKLYIVEEGSVFLKKRIMGDIEKKLFAATTGFVFGEFSFMDGGERSASAFVEEDASILSLGRSDLDVFIQKNPKTGAKLYRNLLYIVVERLRRTNEAYRHAVRWSLEITGTQKLNFHYLVSEKIDIRVELTTGRVFEGKVLQLEKSDAGYEVVLSDEAGNLALVPYHAIASVTLA